VEWADTKVSTCDPFYISSTHFLTFIYSYLFQSLVLCEVEHPNQNPNALGCAISGHHQINGNNGVGGCVYGTPSGLCFSVHGCQGYAD
jgi:hypothetical protein